VSTRALVTNDDGVDSPGLHVLASAARHAGMEVTVVAPSFDASGSSAAMNARSRSGQIEIEPVPGSERTFGVHGPPALIVRAAMFGAFGPPPDMVLSGVNRGLNTGRSILHSGTVGAALTAAVYGRRAMAVSADFEADDRWEPDSPVVSLALTWLSLAPRATVLNVNVPRSSLSSRLEARSTRLAEQGTVQARMTEAGGPSFVPVTFSGEDDLPAPGSDDAALAEGFVSVTAIRGVTEDTSFDVGTLLGLH
jgi:5'-nucleotidase